MSLDHAIRFTAAAVLAASIFALPSPVHAEPKIDVSCDLSDIHDDPNDGSGEIWAIVHFKWTATDADYVEIPELGQDHRPTTGSVAHINGSEYTFIAVKGDQAVTTPVSCLHAYRHGPGRFGVINYIDTTPHPSTLFANDISLPFHSNKQLDALRDITAQFFLERQMATTSRAAPRNEGLIVYTPAFDIALSLCDPADCNLPQADRDILRQVSYVLWLEPLYSGGANNFRVHILPRVVFNRTRQDDKWNPDPDSLQIATGLSSDILTKLISRLTNG